MDKSLILTRAKSAAIAHDFSTAARLYKELLRDDESNVEYLKQLGSIYVQAGEDEKAIPYYSQIITFYPHFVEAMNSLGAIYRRLKRYEESIEILQRALDEDRQLPTVNYNLGFTYKEMGNYEDAIDSFEKVISANPDDVLAYNHLGSIYYAQKNYEKSIISYKRGLQIDRNHPILNYNLARCYEASKNIADAIHCYQAALKTRPGWTDAIKDYTALLMNCDKNKEAAEIIQQGIKLYPNNTEMLSILGDIYLNDYDYAAAEKIFKRACSVKQNDVRALVGLSKALEKSDKSEYALDAVLSALEVEPDNRDAKKQYVQTLLSEKDYDGAKVTVEDLYNNGGQRDLQVLDLYGQYHICNNDEEAAKECFNTIKAINHHYKDYMLNAANRLAQIGKFDKAEVYANEFLVYRPENIDGYNCLGKINFLREDFEKASEYYKKALTFGKNNALAEKQLKTISDKVERAKLFAEKVEEIAVESQDEEILEMAESLTGEKLTQEEEKEEFDYSLIGGAVPLQEGLVEEEESFWKSGEEDSEEDLEATEEGVEESEAELEPEPEYVAISPEEPETPPEASDAAKEDEKLAQDLSDAADNEDFDLFNDSEEESGENLIEEDTPVFEDNAEEDFDFGQFSNATAEEEPEPEPEPVVVKEKPAIDYEALEKAQKEKEAADKAMEAALNAQKLAQQMAEQQQYLRQQTEDALEKAMEKIQDLQNQQLREQDEKFQEMLETAEDESVEEENSEPEIEEVTEDFEIDQEETESSMDDFLSEDEPEPEPEIEEPETPLVEDQYTFTDEGDPIFIEDDLTIEQMLQKIELILNDDDAAASNANKIVMFKKLRVLCDFLPESEKDTFQSCRMRMVIDYIISKLSGKPGLLITAQSLIKSGVLGNEYSANLIVNPEEELNNELIRQVILIMKSMSAGLEDKSLAQALCASADNILERIELVNQKSQIFG